MAYSGPRNDPGRLFLRRLGILALAIVTLFALSSVWDVYRKERDSRELRKRAELKLAELEMQEAQLRDGLARLHTDRGKEEALRQQYEVGRAGEGLIVIVDSAPQEAPPEPEGFMRWFNKLFRW